MTCFFIGHRDAPSELRPVLFGAVEQHITEYGVTDFVVGHYGRFDAMAAGAIREAKKRHPSVTLTLLTAYYSSHSSFAARDYDQIFYPPGMEYVPKPFAIPRANRYMLTHCEYLICYDMGYPGNTRSLAELARKRENRGLLRQHRTIPGTHLACRAFRHTAQKCSAIHEVFPALFVLPDEKSDGAICAPVLCGVALKMTELGKNT